jgi:IclR family acetate operon transcriptional repressor
MRPAEWDNPAEPPSSVLARGVALLAAFTADDNDLGVSEMSRRTGLSKSTAHRLALELVESGLFERTGTRFRLGMRLFELGQLAPRQRGLRQLATPIMSDLREATHETVHLAVLEGFEVVYVEILASRRAPKLPSRVGGRMPAYATGVGKAILAASPPEVVDAVIENGLHRVSPRTIVMPGRLRAELAAIAEGGTAYDREESGLGTACAASALFGPDGTVVAAISVTGRVPGIDLDRVAPAVRAAALTLSRLLGAPPGVGR